MKSGYFILVEEATEDEDIPPSRDDKKTEHDFNSLSLDELKQMAEENGVDITHCRKKLTTLQLLKLLKRIKLWQKTLDNTT